MIHHDSSLSKSQQDAIAHMDGPAAIYAGPGSGKTRVVTLRAARLATMGKKLLVTTFTNDATEEMRSRLNSILEPSRRENAKVSTLHSLCLQILKREDVKFQLLVDPHLQRNLAEAGGAAECEGGVRKFLSDLSYQKNLGVTCAKYQHDGSGDDMDFARCWRAYEKIKTQKGYREFDDLVLDVAMMLEGDEEIRRRHAADFGYIIVDECQDMNAPQYAVAFALGRDHRNVMLVGDLDQSLYGFRGADTVTFQRFAKHSSTKVYELRENYRSTRSILNFADSLIRQDEERHALDFIPTQSDGEPVLWDRYPDPDIEAIATGDEIMRLKKRGAKFSEMAVLYRTNAQAEALERNFAALEIPYALRDDGDFYARKEVQGILSYLNFFVHAEGLSPEAAMARPEAFPDEWLLAFLNVPNRKLSRVVGSQLRHHGEFRNKRIWDILGDFQAEDLRTHRMLGAMRNELTQIFAKVGRLEHAGEAIAAIRTATSFDNWLRIDEKDQRDNDRLQNIQRMQAAAAHYPTIKEYLKAIQKVRDEAARRKSERAKKKREQDEVTLSTGHSAKGLEWRYVFAIGWSEEILPHRKSITEPSAINEERRIAYVIATRAKERLWVSTLDSWNDAPVGPSRFLTDAQLTPSSLLADNEVEDDAPIVSEVVDDVFGGLFMAG